MRARLITVLVIGLLAVAAPTALAADPPTAAFGGSLTGAQENPPVVTAGTGEATVVIAPDDSVIWYVVTYSGLSGPVVAAHIHTGAVGVNGGIILPLTVATSPMTGTLTAANFTPSGAITTYAQAVAAIKAGETYVNLHTAANPGGEIRAQLVAKGNAHFATLTGAQEVPSVATAATGQGWVVISTDQTTITYFASFTGLSGPVVAAHIHLGNVGANGGVMLPLTASVSPMTGTLNASNFAAQGSVTTFAAALAAIAAGGTYVNIHTAANPGGEIRGQLAVFVPAPVPTPVPTAAPVAPAPTAIPTVPPTATDTIGGTPSGSLGWLILLAIVAAIAAVALPHRRSSVRESTSGGARPDRR